MKNVLSQFSLGIQRGQSYPHWLVEHKEEFPMSQRKKGFYALKLAGDKASGHYRPQRKLKKKDDEQPKADAPNGTLNGTDHFTETANQKPRTVKRAKQKRKTQFVFA